MRKPIVILSVCLLGLGLSTRILIFANSIDPADVKNPRDPSLNLSDDKEQEVEPTTLEVLRGEELTTLVSRLGRIKPGPEQKRAVAQLAQGGETTTDEIERQLAERSKDFGWVHSSVRVLEKINSEKSRTILRKIAKGEIEMGRTSPQAWAASRLIACDPQEARGLLSSSDGEVLEAAMLSFRNQGLHLDRETVDVLKAHIKSENPRTRSLAASALTQAPAGELAEQALDGMKDALAAVAKIPDLDKIDPSSGQINYQLTISESHYGDYMRLLPQMNVGNGALFEMADELNGRARDTVLLALAWRAEPKVHDDIVRIAKAPDAGMLRAWAVTALVRIYRVEDLPLLRKLAETDPLKRGGGGGDIVVPKGFQNPKLQYPVRFLAEQTIKTIERSIKQK